MSRIQIINTYIYNSSYGSLKETPKKRNYRIIIFLYSLILVSFLLLSFSFRQSNELTYRNKNDVVSYTLKYLKENDGKDSTDFTDLSKVIADEILNSHNWFTEEILDSRRIQNRYDSISLPNELNQFKQRNDRLIKILPWNYSSDTNVDHNITLFYSTLFEGFFTVTVYRTK